MELCPVSNALWDLPLGLYWVSTAFSLSLLLLYLWKFKGNAQGYFPHQIIVFYLHCKRLFPGRPNRGAGVITTRESSWLGPSAVTCEQHVFHPGSLGLALSIYSLCTALLDQIKSFQDARKEDTQIYKSLFSSSLPVSVHKCDFHIVILHVLSNLSHRQGAEHWLGALLLLERYL